MTGAIFDLDGTLLDSMEIWNNFGADYLLARGLVPPEDLNQTLKPMSLPQAVDHFKKIFGLTDTAEEMLQQFSDQIERKYRYEVKLKPCVVEFLEDLKSKGVRMCVATATDRKQAEAALRNLGILSYFSFILSCTEATCGKSQPEFFEQALKQLGTEKNQTVVFEDALHAVITAKSAGFRVVGVEDFSAGDDAEQIQSIADYYIKDFSQWEEISL